jgi:hypothetical protein
MGLMFEAMALEADEGLTLTACTAEQGTPPRDALALLASWAARNLTEESAGSTTISRGSGPQP